MGRAVQRKLGPGIFEPRKSQSYGVMPESITAMTVTSSPGRARSRSRDRARSQARVREQGHHEEGAEARREFGHKP